MNPLITIIDYAPELQDAIRKLNYEWLEKQFKLEPGDIRTLGDPQHKIIDQGGHIFYARMNNDIVGTASLLRKSDSVFELSKMAVTQSAQGFGIGKLLLEHCFGFARTHNITRLILYSNTKLAAAIHLYKKFGFIEMPLVDGVYERANIKMYKDI